MDWGNEEKLAMCWNKRQTTLDFRHRKGLSRCVWEGKAFALPSCLYFWTLLCACAAWASPSSEALHQELGSPSAIPWCFPLSWKKQKGWRLPVCSLLVQCRQWPHAHLSHKSTERSGPYFGSHSPQWPKGDFISGFHQNVLEGWDTSHWEPGLNVSSNSFISVVPRVAGSRNLSSGSIYTALENATHQSIRAFLFRGILLVFMSSSSHIYIIKQYISYIWYF